MTGPRFSFRNNDVGAEVLRRSAILNRAGLPHGRRDMFHKFRRTCATYIAQAAGKAAASGFLGHSSLAITAVYLDETKLDGNLELSEPLPEPVGRAATDATARPLVDLLPEYEAEVLANLHPVYAKSSKHRVLTTCCWCSFRTVAEINAVAMAQHLDRLKREGSKATTIEDYRAAFQGFAEWLTRKGYATPGLADVLAMRKGGAQ